LYVEHFLKIDVGNLTFDELADKVTEASYVREIEVNVLTEATANAIIKCFGG